MLGKELAGISQESTWPWPDESASAWLMAVGLPMRKERPDWPVTDRPYQPTRDLQALA